MHNYIDNLGLAYDPFSASAGPATAGKSFFTGAGRQQLLDALVEQVSHGGGLLSVTGALGAGKTSLADALASTLGKDVVCLSLQATLFMSRSQFLEQLEQNIGLGIEDIEAPAAVDTVCAFANDLALNARTLVLIIDDAHELASDVFNLLFTLLRRNSGGGFAVVLLGETQLDKLLQANLPETQRKHLQQYQLQAFSSEDSFEYIRFKLANAGYRKPLPLSGGELGALHNAAAGLPGILNNKLAAALEKATSESGADNARSAGSSLWALGQGYWAVAGGLGLILLILLLIQPSPQPEQNESSGQRQISVTTAADRAAPAQVIDAPDSADSASTEVPVGQQAQSTTAPVTAPPPEPTAEQTQARETRAAMPAAPDSPLRPFEQELLSYAADSFTVQVMAASSADKIEQFLSDTPALNAAGYYETRFQGKPWFVVVAGNFSSRTAAQAAIDSLPAAVRDLQPWVRSVADIQSSIRNLPR